MDYQWHDVVGNLGVLMILGTYLLVQMDRLDVQRLTYSLLNAFGAGFVTVSLLFDFNLSAFVIEVAWVTVSCYGIARRWGLRRAG